jgi:hypothetical protein
MGKVRTKIHPCASIVGRDSDSLRVEQSGDRIVVGGEFSATAYTGLVPTQWLVPAHSRGQSGRNVALNTHPHLATRLRKYSYTSTPLLPSTQVE